MREIGVDDRVLDLAGELGIVEREPRPGDRSPIHGALQTRLLVRFRNGARWVLRKELRRAPESDVRVTDGPKPVVTVADAPASSAWRVGQACGKWQAIGPAREAEAQAVTDAEHASLACRIVPVFQERHDNVVVPLVAENNALRRRVSELENEAIRTDERHAESMRAVRERAEHAERRVVELEGLEKPAPLTNAKIEAVQRPLIAENNALRKRAERAERRGAELDARVTELCDRTERAERRVTELVGEKLAPPAPPASPAASLFSEEVQSVLSMLLFDEREAAEEIGRFEAFASVNRIVTLMIGDAEIGSRRAEVEVLRDLRRKLDKLVKGVR